MLQDLIKCILVSSLQLDILLDSPVKIDKHTQLSRTVDDQVELR